MTQKLFRTTTYLIFSLIFLSACSVSIDGEQYKAVEPDFNIESFFDGKVKAWGIVQNRDGDVVQRFVVNIDGYMKEGNLILDETFEYGVGEGPLTRVWTLSKNANGTYTGNAGDIAGPATGTPYGNAFNFVYEMDLAVDDSTYRVNFDDWFWAFDENTMMNRSYIKKFGLVMAEVTIFMQKQ
ncbi:MULTISPECIES: DUF3833 domain-containing protein [Alteromonadaceae]|uniref:DUF3833 domain-containing protein n=1 Tax=Brumicola blandensis TaxID=3075611 RepID=A0AAW8R557_9ALTE|nr:MULTISPECIES: DUF3833 domain-containing protein [unclassified Alteromonas]MDT0583193.1 DUF3833 domain-containing protein [Alteromonas sp. W409]MDT0627499.1 DUF3833 domain-containing protein [Alteromonas sp. W364]